MPHLRQWSEDSLRFTNVTDQTSEGRTSDAEFTTMTSLLPLDHGAVAFRFPGNHYAALPRVLTEHGYTTLSAVSFEPGFWNRQVMHPAYGFQRSLFEPDFQMTEQIGWGLNDHDFLQQMVPRLEQLRRPFAAWLITLSLHHPFESFPDKHKVLKLGALEGTSFGNYLHTMRFFDQALEDFKAALARDGLLDNSLLVVFGDHDAGFARDAALARTIGIGSGDAAWTLNDRVPLFIRAGGAGGAGAAGRRVGRCAGAARNRRWISSAIGRCRLGRQTSRRRCSPCSGSIRHRCRISDGTCSAPRTIGRCLARTATGSTRIICSSPGEVRRPATISCAISRPRRRPAPNRTRASAAFAICRVSSLSRICSSRFGCASRPFRRNEYNASSARARPRCVSRRRARVVLESGQCSGSSAADPVVRRRSPCLHSQISLGRRRPGEQPGHEPRRVAGARPRDADWRSPVPAQESHRDARPRRRTGRSPAPGRRRWTARPTPVASRCAPPRSGLRRSRRSCR